jgi:hypothetical protein
MPPCSQRSIRPRRLQRYLHPRQATLPYRTRSSTPGRSSNSPSWYMRSSRPCTLRWPYTWRRRLRSPLLPLRPRGWRSTPASRCRMWRCRTRWCLSSSPRSTTMRSSCRTTIRCPTTRQSPRYRSPRRRSRCSGLCRSILLRYQAHRGRFGRRSRGRARPQRRGVLSRDSWVPLLVWTREVRAP